MATLTGGQKRTVYTIRNFSGINQSPDGDADLLMGQAAYMENWRVTREGNLRIRPGVKTLYDFGGEGQTQLRGLWSGLVAGQECLIAACKGHLWRLSLSTDSTQAEDLGSIYDAPVCFIPFSGKLYILDGQDYYCFGGSGQIERVTGYIPIIYTATPPSGGGVAAEQVNLLTGSKRQRFSPYGSEKNYCLAEKEIDSVDRVTVSGVAVTGYTCDKTTGVVTLAQAPAVTAPDSVEITWTKGAGRRSELLNMRFSEIYGGENDTRVFLYGDGTNRISYSGLTEQGCLSAEYFPVLNTMDVGSGNTPVTALCRQYDRLLIFKSSEAWYAAYAPIASATGQIPAFSVLPLNSSIGCEAPGQAVLVENAPFTLSAGAVYKWVSSSVRDERNAQRVSDRVQAFLAGMTLSQATVFDNEREREWWLCCADKAVIYNYANDAWYLYSGIPAFLCARYGGQLIVSSRQGVIARMTEKRRSDDGREIDAVWESGSMAFADANRYKYANAVCLTLKPDSRVRVHVGVQTDADVRIQDMTAASGLSTLCAMDFGHFSFRVNRKPFTVRLRFRTGRFTFYKLFLKSSSASSTATVLSASVPVSYANML